jgi:internalin A
MHGKTRGDEIALSLIKEGIVTHATMLNLWGFGLTVLPAEIGKLTNLISLDLSNNQLTTLPAEIGLLTNLVELNLAENHLSSLPAEIGRLTKLPTLNLDYNQLASLPAEIGNLINLTSLSIRKNRLRVLPREIGNPYNLNSLDLSDNKLAYLPEEIGKLTNLSRLYLANNELKTLPDEIGNLEQLEYLILEQNDLSKLPDEIFGLEKLKQFDLRGNNLKIPLEILEKTDEPKTILNYYFETKRYVFEEKEGDSKQESSKKILESIFITRATGKYVSSPINEAKLILVGQGSVGKTSLIQQLIHGTFNQNQNKTEGIIISQWKIDMSQDVARKIKSTTFLPVETSKQLTINIGTNQININIWDFGGQEIMHATHQFFLTKRSLYLLVLDARLTQEENRVEYWLKIIQSFGGESPVLIIGNKTDQHPLDIDRTGLQKKYPNVVGILETSAATGAGIEPLKAEISTHTEALPHIRDLLPGTWFIVKTKMEKLGREKNFITQDEFLSLCEANGVSDETSQHTLIGFLHDLGVVLHFQDDPRLEALGILNPQWVTNGVYKILNSHELFQNQGTLTLPILNKTLNPPEYPRDKRLFIVDMMKKFELCYDIEPDKSFLIPDLLSKDEPYLGENEWKDALAFQVHYNVLPSSIITRFIVRMNAFFHKTVWRSGVVLKSGRNTALVKADTEDRKIYIWVAGDENTRRDFLSAIRMEFEAIHKTIAKIESTEKVPFPNYPKADPVDYAFLLQLERDARESFPASIDGKIVDINVRELLNGIRPAKTQAAKVFISYSHQDKSFVKKLAGELEGKGMKVWWDFDSLKGGQDWQKEIERAIKQCDYFLVALTTDAIDSEWVGNEITYASNAQKTIIPLHLKRCDIPIGLIKKQYIDFQKQTHKLALKELIAILQNKQ